MLDKLTVFAERWYVFVPILAAAVISYVVGRLAKSKKVKIISGAAGLIFNAALIVASLICGAIVELTLLMLLASLLLALLI